MNKCLIYNFSGELEEITHIFPSERLARIAAVIRAHGGKAVIVDRANFADFERFGSACMENLGNLTFYESNPDYAEVVEQEARVLLEYTFDTLLINLWHGSGFKFSMDLIKALKVRRPEIKIYGIGQKVDWFKEHILDLTGDLLDGLITGLGYNAVRGLVGGEAPSAIPNMILKSGNGVIINERESIDLDEYPLPVYDPEIYLRIDQKAPIYSIALSNQACPNHCVYCVRPENYGKIMKRRSTAAVIKELEELRFRHGITHFRVEDSTPPTDALTELARAIIDSRLKGEIRLCAFSRVDMNGTEDFELMREAGIVSLFFGIESMDDDNLRRLSKGFSKDAVSATLRKASEASINVVGSFIFPTPGETEQSMANTLRGIREIKPYLNSIVVLPAGVYPPTRWGQSPGEYGIKLDDDYIEKSVIYPIKYLVPLKYWKPLPFRYELMGKAAEDVTFEDIVQLQERFNAVVRGELGLAGIPDYYFLIADLLRDKAGKVAKMIVAYIMERNYRGLRNLFIGDG